jgi:hypothetical protein
VTYIQEQVESVVSVVEKNLKNCTKEMLPEFQNKEWDDFQHLFSLRKEKGCIVYRGRSRD